MEMRQLKYFIEIVNSKSFSKAATTLYTTQPALTKSIKLLEDELGFKLIDRSTSYFKLTDKEHSFISMPGMSTTVFRISTESQKIPPPLPVVR